MKKLLKRSWLLLLPLLLIGGLIGILHKDWNHHLAAAYVTPYLDVTTAVGITTTHGISGSFMITGQAWGDYDRDGDPDLYLTNSTGANDLYENISGTFALSPHWGQLAWPQDVSGGTLFADYNNDGWLDLYLLNKGANRLLQYQPGVGFVDVTAVAAVGDTGQGESAAWGDYDGDGWLDLYVANWSCAACPDGALDRLYHNEQDGTFTDVTSLLAAGNDRPAFAVAFLDYDNDGDLDFYVVNDKLAGNLLWRNDGAGCSGWCFTDVSAVTGSDIAVNGMGIAIGDYDQDQDLDLFFTHTGPGHLLQNQSSQGSPIFVDVTAAAQVDFAAIGWGALFFDYDNDGWLDLYMSTMDNDPAKKNRLWHNAGDGTFTDVSAASGADNNGRSIGVASADFNRDGGIDLLVGNWGEPYTLYQNQPTNNNWITLQFAGSGPVNQDGIGTRVYLTTTNGLQQMQELKSGSSIGAGEELLLHFGLGDGEIAALRLVWPNGRQMDWSAPLPINTQWLLSYPQEKIYLPHLSR